MPSFRCLSENCAGRVHYARGLCKICYDRWHKSTPKGRQKNREANRKCLTGWSADDVSRVWTEQSGACAICTRPMLPSGQQAESMAVDHCHTTKRPRGLLCSICNRSLGNYEKHQRATIVIDVYEVYLSKY